MEFELQNPVEIGRVATEMSMDRRRLVGLGVAGIVAGSALPLLGGCEDSSEEYGKSIKDVDVVVIGAGLSGLVAANRLLDAGVASLAVLEANDRVGGRTLNQTLRNGIVTNAGATWIGPGQDEIYRLCRNLGIGVFPSYWEGKALMVRGEEISPAYPMNRPINDPALVEKIDRLAQTVDCLEPWKSPNAVEFDSKTFKDWLLEQGMDSQELEDKNLLWALSFGAPADQMSFLQVLVIIKSAGSFELLEGAVGGAQQDRISGGSQSVSLKLAEALGARVHVGQPVKRVSNWNGPGPVTVETAKGAWRAKRVVLALNPALAAGINFQPELPEARQALLDGWPSAPDAYKLYLQYDRPFWREKGYSGLIFTLDDILPGVTIPVWYADMSPPDGSVGVIKVLTSSHWAFTTRGAKDRMIATLARCYGPEAKNVQDMVSFDWNDEPFTSQCVTPSNTGFLSEIRENISKPNGNLHWAGTETSDKWQGYMDGAVRAGKRSADEVVSSLTG